MGAGERLKMSKKVLLIFSTVPGIQNETFFYFLPENLFLASALQYSFGMFTCSDAFIEVLLYLQMEN